MMENRHVRVLIIIPILLILAGCGSKSNSTLGQQGTDPEAQARQMMQTGQYDAAAVEYLRLSNLDEQHVTIYRLKAASAYIEAGLFADAQSILDTTEVSAEDSVQVLQRSILYARLALKQGLPAVALQHLQHPPPPDTPRSLLATWYDIFADAQMQNRNYIGAIQTRMALTNYLDSTEDRNSNYKKIWQGINSLSLALLENQRTEASPELASWYELGILHKTMRFDTQKFGYAIDAWIQRYPGHPAYSVIVPVLISESQQLGHKPEHIALLLPFSGQYLKASNAIRDGFIAAWYEEKNNRPKVSVYDTNSLNVLEVYQQAVDDGADFIVGPLEKNAIDELAKQAESELTILALNHTDSNNEFTNSKLIQFGLSPEDEVEQVAERAWFDGHALALVITPNIPWGDRIYAAFKTRWEQLGGKILEQKSFENVTQDYASPVKQILNIDSSERRAKELKNKLGIKIKSEGRRRKDADFIFLAAVPVAARQLKPQLKFYHAGEVPVYSTSHVYSGITDANKDLDMNGIRFVDIPWVLDLSHELSLIQDNLNKSWNTSKSSYRRLYALGIDAYRLIPELGRLSSQQDFILEGETGDLTLTKDRKIKRKLQWATFVEGKPVLEN